MTGSTLLALKARIRTVEVVYEHHDGLIEQPFALGVMADLAASDWWGLGLMAPKAMDRRIVDSVGEVVRPLFEKPFDSLSSEFKRLWDVDDPVGEFSKLSIRHRTSLTFRSLPSSNVIIPKGARDDEDVFRLWAKDQLTQTLTKAWWKLGLDGGQRGHDEDVKRVAA